MQMALPTPFCREGLRIELNSTQTVSLSVWRPSQPPSRAELGERCHLFEDGFDEAWTQVCVWPEPLRDRVPRSNGRGHDGGSMIQTDPLLLCLGVDSWFWGFWGLCTCACAFRGTASLGEQPGKTIHQSHNPHPRVLLTMAKAVASPWNGGSF